MRHSLSVSHLQYMLQELIYFPATESFIERVTVLRGAEYAVKSLVLGTGSSEIMVMYVSSSNPQSAATVDVYGSFNGAFHRTFRLGSGGGAVQSVLAVPAAAVQGTGGTGALN